MLIESENDWAGRDLKDHLVPTPNNQQSQAMLSIKYDGKGEKRNQNTKHTKPPNHQTLPWLCL